MVFANPRKGKTGYADTGHIMLVTAVQDCPDDSQPNLLVKHVVVIDETGSPHSDDTRSDQKANGIGMGIIKLTSSESGELQFYWSLAPFPPEQGNITLGRAL